MAVGDLSRTGSLGNVFVSMTGEDHSLDTRLTFSERRLTRDVRLAMMVSRPVSPAPGTGTLKKCSLLLTRLRRLMLRSVSRPTKPGSGSTVMDQTNFRPNTVEDCFVKHGKSSANRCSCCC